MAKKQSLWDVQRDLQLNATFSGLVKSASEPLGGQVMIGREPESHQVGLWLPALCLRYLFQLTCMPLSRVMQIAGEEGSAKSAFLYELIRLHCANGGGAVLAENENKDSPILRHSILQWNEDYLNRLITKKTYCVEEWQHVFTHFLQQFKAIMDAKDGPGRTLPILLAVDSIMGTATRGELDAIESSGFAERGYAVAANIITRYMRSVPEGVQTYPFTLVGTNHLKPSTTPNGLPTNTIPGGKSVKFHETYEVTMKKAPQGAHIDLLDYGGLRVQFKLEKNSAGPGKKTIVAELLWWQEIGPDGMPRQVTAWDWHSASVEMLLGFESSSKTVFSKVADITGIRAASKRARTAYSELLGIPKDDPQPYRVVGGLLESRPDILAPLHIALGIGSCAIFQPSIDYGLQQEAAKAAALAKEREQCDAGHIEGLPVLGEEQPVATYAEESDDE